MNKSDSINELAQALAKAQGQMTPAKMEATNPFLKNKYADLGSVIQAARKALTDNGLSFSQHPAIDDGSVSITTVLMHASGQWMESTLSLPIGEEKGLSLAQSMGKVVTYLRRYSLSAVLGIYADEDTDGNDDKTAGRPNARPALDKRTPPPNGKAVELRNQLNTAVNAPGTSEAPRGLQPLTRTEAENVVTSENQRYGDLDSGKLSFMENSIRKALSKNGLTIEQKETCQYKLAAIDIILTSREAEDALAIEMNEGA